MKTGGGNSYISKSLYNRYDLVKALAITSISDTVTPGSWWPCGRETFRSRRSERPAAVSGIDEWPICFHYYSVGGNSWDLQLLCSKSTNHVSDILLPRNRPCLPDNILHRKKYRTCLLTMIRSDSFYPVVCILILLMGKRSSGFIYFWIFVYQQNIWNEK
jgi:hypothetical protein